MSVNRSKNSISEVLVGEFVVPQRTLVEAEADGRVDPRVGREPAPRDGRLLEEGPGVVAAVPGGEEGGDRVELLQVLLLRVGEGPLTEAPDFLFGQSVPHPPARPPHAHSP